MSWFDRIEREIPALRRYAWSLLRNRADADDLVQDCLVRALDRAHRQEEGELRPWLFTIMHNLHVSRWRTLTRRARVDVEDAEADLAVDPAQAAHSEMRDVLRALDTLAPEQKQVLLLVAVEGLAYEEVARVTGVPVGTVMSRLSRARDRLREQIDGRPRPMLRRVK